MVSRPKLSPRFSYRYCGTIVGSGSFVSGFNSVRFLLSGLLWMSQRGKFLLDYIFQLPWTTITKQSIFLPWCSALSRKSPKSPACPQCWRVPTPFCCTRLGVFMVNTSYLCSAEIPVGTGVGAIRQLITVQPLALAPSSSRNVSHVEQNQMLPPPTQSIPVLQQPCLLWASKGGWSFALAPL